MNRQEHLLTIGSEECAEVAQRISKALRFGLTEVQPGGYPQQSNRERIRSEFADLVAVLEMAGIITTYPIPGVGANMPGVSIDIQRSTIEAKKAKVEQFLDYSRSRGTLKEGEQTPEIEKLKQHMRAATR